jgi:hypothetical protein
MRHMVIQMPEFTGYAGIRHVAVSLPLVDALIDGVKYRMPDDDVKLARDFRRSRRPRGPSCARWCGGP